MFTRITVVVAAIWIVLCILATNVLGTKTSRLSPALGGAAAVPTETGEGPAMEPAEPETKPDAEAGKPSADADAADAATEKPDAAEAGPGPAAEESKADASAKKPVAADDAAVTPEPPPAAE